jgi:hypothetical protein
LPFLRGQSTCEVKFEIVAEVYQQMNSVFHSNPSAKEELVVEAATSITPHHDTSLALPAEIIPVNGCCCSKKGTMGLETKFDKTTLPASSPLKGRSQSTDSSQENTVTIQFRCLNRSTVRANKVRVQLQETIEWTSNGHTEQLRTVLAKAELDASHFPELDKLRKRERRREQRREYFGLPGGADSGMVALQDQPWHTVGPLQVPHQAKDSYQGRAIQVRHVLSVEILTKGCCMSNPDVTTLIQIYRRLAQPKEAVDEFAMDHIYQEQHSSTPSAPFEDDPSVTPSAPSEFYDEPPPHSSSASFYPEVTATAVPSLSTCTPAASDVFVQAQVLPDDWHAQTAEVVTIPMAEAIVLGPASAGVRQPNGAVAPSAPPKDRYT